MKIKFSPTGLATEDVNGEYEVVDTVLTHRFSLVDGEVVDAYPDKTDLEVRQIEHVAAQKKAADDIKIWNTKTKQADDSMKSPAELATTPTYTPAAPQLHPELNIGE